MKIAVIGGGFAGLLAAYKLSGAGVEIDLYEEHDRVGYPPHCTGIVSERVVEGIGRPARETTQAVYDGFEVVTGDSRLRIRTRRPIYKLDRVRLEHKLLREAEKNGARIHLETRVEEVSPNGEVRARGSTSKYDLVILAEGLSGRVRRKLGIYHKPVTSRGINLETPEPSRDPWFEVYFGPKAGSGFTWRVPAGKTTIVGALSLQGDPKVAVEKVYGPVETVKGYGGRVIHGPPLRNPAVGRVLLLGDAAAHNKPLTGGGLYPVTEIIVNSIQLAKQEVPLDRALVKSARNVTNRLIRQYRLARLLLSDTQLTTILVASAARAGLDEALRGRIDYDYHEDLVRQVIRHPLRATRTGFMMLAKNPAGTLRILLAGLRAML